MLSAIWGTEDGIGVAIGPMIGGLLLAHFWWGSVFLINVPIAVVGAVGRPAASSPSRATPPPARSTMLACSAPIAGLVLLVYGIVQGGDGASWTSARRLGPALGAAWLVLGACSPGTRAASTILRWTSGCSATGGCRPPSGVISLLFFGFGGVYFFTSFYLQNVRGYSPLAADLLVVPFALGQFVMAPRSASLVTPGTARGPSASAGMALTAVAIGGYATLGTASPIWILAVPVRRAGRGRRGAVPAATAAVMDVLPRERAGAGPR